MNSLQCHYCQRWLETTPEVVRYYETAKHPVLCGRCARESDEYIRTNFAGHTFIIRTPEWVSIDSIPQ